MVWKQYLIREKRSADRNAGIQPKSAERLRQYGAASAEISLIYPSLLHPDKLKQLSWESYTWAVMTSANGVEMLFAAMRQAGVDLRSLLHLRFAAIGKGTAQALADHGIFVDCVPEHFDSRSLAEALIPELTENDRVLLLRAENGSVLLPQLLEQAGKAFDNVPLYTVKTDRRKQELLRRNWNAQTMCSLPVHLRQERLRK